jgi:hypothetical protein
MMGAHLNPDGRMGANDAHSQRFYVPDTQKERASGHPNKCVIEEVSFLLFDGFAY